MHLKSTFVTCLTVHYCHRHCNRLLPSLLPCVSLDKQRETSVINTREKKQMRQVLACFHFDRVHCHIKCMRARERDAAAAAAKTHSV